MDPENIHQHFNHHIRLDQPAEYLIKVQGQFTGPLSDWFQGEVCLREAPGAGGEAVTVVQGVIVDQAALHGLLAYIRNLGLPLLYADCLSARGADLGSSLKENGNE